MDVYHAVKRGALPEAQLGSVFIFGPVAVYNIVQVLGRLRDEEE
jgi:hypothetical protein